MTESPELDGAVIVEILERHHVEYVLVGGYAAQVHGASRATKDIDVTPATTDENLERLASALRELRAGIRVDAMPEGLPFDTSAEALRGVRMLNLRSPHGDLDLTFQPAGFPNGYDDLIRNAKSARVGQVNVHLAALDDVIASKAEAGRPKDLEALPELYRLAGRIRPAE